MKINALYNDKNDFPLSKTRVSKASDSYPATQKYKDVLYVAFWMVDFEQAHVTAV